MEPLWLGSGSSEYKCSWLPGPASAYVGTFVEMRGSYVGFELVRARGSLAFGEMVGMLRGSGAGGGEGEKGSLGMLWGSGGGGG